MPPTYNPLVGWTPGESDLVGHGMGGREADAGIGYDGSVNSLGDFAKALGGGASVVMGGFPGFLGMMANTAMGNSPVAGLSGLVQSARDWASNSPTSQSAPVTAVTAMDLPALDVAGTSGEGASSGGESTNTEQEAASVDPAALFANGGYTGGVEGRPAGIVHGNELVLAAPTVRALGPLADDLARVNALTVAREPMRARSWAEMIMMQHPDIWHGAA